MQVSRPGDVHSAQGLLLLGTCGELALQRCCVSPLRGMMDATQHWREAVEWSVPVQELPSDSFPSAVLLTKDDGKEIALNSWKINLSRQFPGIQGTGLFK